MPSKRLDEIENFLIFTTTASLLQEVPVLLDKLVSENRLLNTLSASVTIFFLSVLIVSKICKFLQIHYFSLSLL